MTTYNFSELTAGDILTNKTGSRQIQLIRTFERKTKTQVKRVWVYSVLDKNGNVDYNDQKTRNELYNNFPYKIA